MFQKFTDVTLYSVDCIFSLSSSNSCDSVRSNGSESSDGKFQLWVQFQSGCFMYSFYTKVTAYMQIFLNTGKPAKNRQLT